MICYAGGNYAGILKASEYGTNLNLVLIIQVITKSDQSYLIDRLGGAVYAAECVLFFFFLMINYIFKIKRKKRKTC